MKSELVEAMQQKASEPKRVFLPSKKRKIKYAELDAKGRRKEEGSGRFTPKTQR